MKKIKLLHIITGLGIGGAEKVVFDLCRFSDKQQFETQVLAVNPLKEMLPQFIKENIQVSFVEDTVDQLYNPITKRISNALVRAKKMASTINKIIKDQKIEIIHAHMVYPGLFAPIIKFLNPSIPIIFTSHNHNLESTFKETLLFLSKKWRNTDIIFSEKMKRGLYKKNAIVIPNGIRTSEYDLQLKKFKTFTFLCIGRLAKQKNQLGLIQPIKQLVEKGYHFQVLFVGAGKDKTKIEKAIEDSQLQNVCKLLGLRKDIPQLCNAAHALLMPSIFEGLPITLLESGASGLPVIATTVGSIPSVLNEENGYPVSQFHHFASTMETVMNNYDQACEKGKKLKAKIQKDFDVTTITQQHESIYMNLYQQSKRKKSSK